MNMKKLWCTLFTGVILLTGCNSPTESENTVIEKTEAAAPTTYVPTDEEAIQPMEIHPLGEWIDTFAYSELTGSFQLASLHITGITRGKEAEDKYKDYFARYGAEYKSTINSEMLEYVVVSYEVLLPDNFPSPEQGTYLAPVSFKPVNREGISEFNGLELVNVGVDISETVDLLKPSQISSTQEFIFVLFKDVPNGEYLIECNSNGKCVYIETA